MNPNDQRRGHSELHAIVRHAPRTIPAIVLYKKEILQESNPSKAATAGRHEKTDKNLSEKVRQMIFHNSDIEQNIFHNIYIYLVKTQGLSQLTLNMEGTRSQSRRLDGS